jgi:hypothetical protein
MKSPEVQRLYWVWAAMIQRCHNPRNPGFKNYGGKGVAVCDRWRHSFDAFRSDMGLPPAGHSIERQDNSAGYEPGNCVWATRADQNRNRPSWCRYVEINGERLTLKDAWRKHAHASITYRAFVKRVVSRGWSLSDALSTPVREAA